MSNSPPFSISAPWHASFKITFSPFLSDGRLRFHSCMCSCCKMVNGKKMFTFDLEPIPIISYNDSYGSSMKNIIEAKGMDFLYNCCILFYVIFSSKFKKMKFLDSLLQFIHSSPCGSQVFFLYNIIKIYFKHFPEISKNFHIQFLK